MADRLRKAHRFATVPEHLIRDQTLSDRAFRLWCVLDRYAGAADSAFPRRATLAGDLCCSTASLDRAITELVDGGWLHKERRGRGESNVYTLLVAKVPSVTRRRSVIREGVVTGEDSRVVTSDESVVITGDDTLSSPVMTGVVTSDEHKEEPPKDESSKDSPSADAEGRDLNAGRDDVERLCTHLADRIEANGSRRPTITKRWRDAARLLMDTDGRTEEQVHAAIDWCQAHEFWRANILSMPTLREKYDTLRLRAQAERSPRPIENRHNVPENDPDRAARVAAFGGQRASEA